MSSPFSTRLLNTYLGHPIRALTVAARLLAAAHLTITYFYSWGATSGPSMLPGWEVFGQGAVVSHLHRRGAGVRVGDLVKYRIPINDGEGIKRVAGLPGDYVLVHSPGGGPGHMIQVRVLRHHHRKIRGGRGDLPHEERRGKVRFCSVTEC